MIRRRLAWVAIVGVVIVLALLMVRQNSSPSRAEDQSIPRSIDEIAANLVSGGPQKDGIPSIDRPRYVEVSQASFLTDDDLIFGVDYGGIVAAYPKKILYWHEIVNEEGDGNKMSVTYCPLTGSVIGYLGKDLGVSGSLYNSNLVFYDRKTDSRYPQMLGVAVDGPAKGEILNSFPITVTTWKAWRTLYPHTKVLSPDSGFERDYNRNPYPGYEDLLRVWFPIAAQSDRFPTKTVVHGIEYNGKAYAIHKEHFRSMGRLSIPNTDLEATYDPLTDTINLNKPVKHFDVYWFAWYAYHPDTEVFS